MVKRFAAGAGIAVAIVLASAGIAAAQSQRPSDVEQVRARQKISTMEAVLERAVANGADIMLRQVRQVMPEAPMLTGAPQVRGFRLDGYGVFFDVDVPGLRIPIAWTLRYMVDDNGLTAGTALAELRGALAQHVADARERARLEQYFRRIELQVGPAQPRQNVGRAGAGAATVSAQSVQGTAPPPASPVDPGVIDDPNESYTREVKAALIDAMLENSGPIGVGPDEWLAVAARDNIGADRLVPTDATDLHTIMFRVKGSDLSALHAGRITLEEARKRVEIREF